MLYLTLSVIGISKLNAILTNDVCRKVGIHFTGLMFSTHVMDMARLKNEHIDIIELPFVMYLKLAMTFEWDGKWQFAGQT
jgi:hypothetical protein